MCAHTIGYAHVLVCHEYLVRRLLYERWCVLKKDKLLQRKGKEEEKVTLRIRRDTCVAHSFAWVTYANLLSTLYHLTLELSTIKRAAALHIARLLLLKDHIWRAPLFYRGRILHSYHVCYKIAHISYFCHSLLIR